ncbi:MAG TPA: hypothetical protein VGH87_26160 [Polyangiaceae bacterium]|jgi:hypothetical protein
MRNLAIRTIPLALFSSACAMQPWTPSVPVAYWSQPVPEGKTAMTDVHSSDVIARWALPDTDPWAPYQKMTLLTSLDDMAENTKLPYTDGLDVVMHARLVARRLAAAGIPPGTMIVADMRGPASVAFGAELSRNSQTPVSLVLTFNNWPAEDELIPAEETLSALVHDSPRAQGGGPPVFLLDAWRLAFRFDESEPGWIDNRYTVTDLPTADVLARQDIKHVIYLVENLDETDVEEDDLHETFTAYQSAGIRISMMDLDSIAEHDVVWTTLLNDSILDVQPRQLIIHDPRFYVGSHGGWGGIRATPGVGGGYHAHWGGGGFHGGGHGGG